MPVKVVKGIEEPIREFKEIIDVFCSSPFILTREGFVSDPFLIIKHLSLADKSNLIVKILLDSSKDLFKKYGRNASLYFSFLKELFDASIHLVHDRQRFLDALAIYANKSFETIESDDRAIFEKFGFSAQVLDAVERADGGQLSLKEGKSSEDTIVEESGFQFVCDIRSPFTSRDALVLVLTETDPYTLAIDFIKRANKPVVVVSTKSLPILAEVEAKNPKANIFYVKSRHEYLTSDFVLDLQAYVNQASELASRSVLRTQTLLGRADVECDGTTITFKSKPSYMLKTRLEILKAQFYAETSPLIKSLLFNRIRIFKIQGLRYTPAAEQLLKLKISLTIILLR